MTVSLSRQLRLAHYLAVVADSSRNGAQPVSSADISTAVGVNATQVRRDLATLGSHGRRGVGYAPCPLVTVLVEAIDRDAVADVAHREIDRLNRVLLELGRQRLHKPRAAT